MTRIFVLLLLLLPGLPGVGAEEETRVVCTDLVATNYTVSSTRIHYARHRCTWYDPWIKADLVHEVERYDGYRRSLLQDYEAHAFTYFTQDVETRYRAGHTQVHEMTFLAVGPTLLRLDYHESRDAQQRQECHGGIDLHTGYELLHFSIPVTPRFPRCPPPGILP